MRAGIVFHQSVLLLLFLPLFQQLYNSVVVLGITHFKPVEKGDLLNEKLLLSYYL